MQRKPAAASKPAVSRGHTAGRSGIMSIDRLVLRHLRHLSWYFDNNSARYRYAIDLYGLTADKPYRPFSDVGSR